jgi:hypothetical protein
MADPPSEPAVNATDNEPFDAVIKLIDGTDGDVDGMRVVEEVE